MTVENQYLAEAHGLGDVALQRIGQWLASDMAVAVRNGANSVSMPDELVEIAAWLAGANVQPKGTDAVDDAVDWARRLAEDWAEVCVKAGYVTTSAPTHARMTAAIKAVALASSQAPAVGDCADLLEALVLMEDAQARIDSLPMFPTTYATEAARFKLFDARQAARAAIAARSHVPVQNNEGEKS